MIRIVVRGLARSIVDHLEASAPDVEFRFSGDELTVDADHALIARAVENVIRNAIRHAPEGTAVEVSLTRHQNSARILVRDRGAGVG